MDLKPSTLSLGLSSMDLKPSTLSLRLSSMDLEPSTLGLRLSSVTLKHSTLSLCGSALGAAGHPLFHPLPGLTHFLCLAKESKQRKARPRWRKTP